MHLCPAVPNAPQRTPSSASSRFASSRTICAFLPPISSETLFKVSAASLDMIFPTAVEPVKLIKSTSGCLTIAIPTSFPPPWTRFTTPSGTPASSSI